MFSEAMNSICCCWRRLSPDSVAPISGSCCSTLEGSRAPHRLGQPSKPSELAVVNERLMAVLAFKGGSVVGWSKGMGPPGL